MMQFLQDVDGNNSSMRLAMIAVVLVVLAGWAYVTIITKTIPDLPAGVLGLVVAVVGGKVWQKYPEGK